jgi:hypothetical protein
MRSAAIALAVVFSVMLVSRAALAQYLPFDEGADEEPGFLPQLGAASGGSIALQSYGGIVAYRAGGALWGHGVAGGRLSARYRYLEVGGYYEASDRIRQGWWTAYGGFAGVFLPFQNWVDFGATVGVGSRTHREDDIRYGPNGYAWSTPSLQVRFSVSDRSGSSLAAVRLGMELYAMMDLKRYGQPWRLEYELPGGLEPLVYTGVTDVGGSSVGLLFSVAFDLSFQSFPATAQASLGRSQG